MAVMPEPFTKALEMIASGDLAGLAQLLRQSPSCATLRQPVGPADYLPSPTLLELLAENPIRTGRMTPMTIEAAHMLLAAGTHADAAAVQSTLALVSSGRVARESGVQTAFITLLCNAGADPNLALLPALAHGEFEAVRALVDHGAEITLAVAAAIGQPALVDELLPAASGMERCQALALAAQHGHAPVVSTLIKTGVPCHQFNPEGCHPHSTPLHQAAAGGHLAVVRLLVAHGANTATTDRVHHATPQGWAEHAGRTAVAAFLAECD